MMTTTSDSPPPPVTVLGLGQMGSGLARVFVDRGHPTTGWNRTASNVRPLVAAGGASAGTAAEAVAASPLVVLCVLDHEATLRELGTPTYHGADAGLASVGFLAQVAVGYELLIGFLHTLRPVQKEGIDVAEFAARLADSIFAYPSLLTAIGEAARDDEYPPDLGPIAVQAPLMGGLVDHRNSLGVDTVRMREVKELKDQSIAAGHGDQGFSSLFASLRSRE